VFRGSRKDSIHFHGYEIIIIIAIIQRGFIISHQNISVFGHGETHTLVRGREENFVLEQYAVPGKAKGHVY
jgi:hypothetical protein